MAAQQHEEQERGWQVVAQWQDRRRGAIELVMYDRVSATQAATLAEMLNRQRLGIHYQARAIAGGNDNDTVETR